MIVCFLGTEYNLTMNIRQTPEWDVNPAQAMKIQKRLSRRIICGGSINAVKLIAGVDVSVYKQKLARAAVVVLQYSKLDIVEVVCIEGKASFPYIPGLLSFREIPLLLEAFKRLEHIPDLILVDGQGTAHPRKMGLASHLGLILNIPTIGCAKSHLYGEFDEPGNERGSFSNLKDKNGSIIGTVLRTKTGVKPLYVSIGHKIDLPSSIHWVLQCCQGYRLPEPTRMAHQASQGNLKSYSGLE
jgi:deoxyribonuclease V